MPEQELTKTKLSSVEIGWWRRTTSRRRLLYSNPSDSPVNAPTTRRNYPSIQALEFGKEEFQLNDRWRLWQSPDRIETGVGRYLSRNYEEDGTNMRNQEQQIKTTSGVTQQCGSAESRLKS
jgi:hypothetical protein